MRQDVEMALSKSYISAFGYGSSIKKAEEMLSKDENVLFVTPTEMTVTYVNTRRKNTTHGVVFLTNKRFLFCSKMIDFQTDSIPINEIKSIDSSGNGLVGGRVEIHTATKTYNILVSYKVNNAKQVQEIQQIFEQALSDYNPQNTVVSSQPNAIEQIEKLAALKDKGIICEDEFNAKKAELLSRL